MKKALFFPLAFFSLMLCNMPVSASWAKPPDEVWETTSNQKFELKRDNTSGTITVYKAGDRTRPIWSHTFPGFSSLFSKIYLSDSGETLLHLRGNHQVNTLDEAAVHVARKNGDQATVPAKDLVEELSRPDGPMMSTSPSFLWLSSFGELRDDGFSVTNANGDLKTVAYKDLKFAAKE